MRYLFTVSVLLTVDGGQHSLEKSGEAAGVQCRKLSNVLLWTEAAAKHILATLKIVTF